MFNIHIKKLGILQYQFYSIGFPSTKIEQKQKNATMNFVAKIDIKGIYYPCLK